MASQKPRPAAPRAFLSYSWDDGAHKEWVKKLATRLMADGVAVTLDRWHAEPGDQIPAFMERAVRENDFVIAVCTPRFKDRSDARGGGVGYEGRIMTAYAFTGGAGKRFIPVLRRGSWDEAAPTWLLGGAYIDLSKNPYSESEYRELLRTLHGAREAAPPVGKRPDFGDDPGSQDTSTRVPLPSPEEPPTPGVPSPITPRDPDGADVDRRRKVYRTRIQAPLRAKLDALARDDGRTPRLLDRIAAELAIEGAGPGMSLVETIADHLLNANDPDAIARLNRLYLELCGERDERPAILIADCIDLLFPLYFAWEVIDDVARQLKRGTLVIEKAVCTMWGADFVLAACDDGVPCFVADADGPRGKHAIRSDPPPIGRPSLEDEVCQILDQILRRLGIPTDQRGTDSVRGDVAARAKRLSASLNGILKGYKIQHRRTLYCVVKQRESQEDRKYALKVLERLRELVPSLVLLELDEDAPRREDELNLGYSLIRRFTEGHQRSSP